MEKSSHFGELVIYTLRDVLLNATKEYLCGPFGVTSFLSQYTISGEEGKQRGQDFRDFLTDSSNTYEQILIEVRNLTLSGSTRLKKCIFTHILCSGVWYEDVIIAISEYSQYYDCYDRAILKVLKEKIRKESILKPNTSIKALCEKR